MYYRDRRLFNMDPVTNDTGHVDQVNSNEANAEKFIQKKIQPCFLPMTRMSFRSRRISRDK